jgi:hypothetical protein
MVTQRLLPLSILNWTILGQGVVLFLPAAPQPFYVAQYFRSPLKGIERLARTGDEGQPGGPRWRRKKAAIIIGIMGINPASGSRRSGMKMVWLSAMLVSLAAVLVASV